MCMLFITEALSRAAHVFEGQIYSAAQEHLYIENQVCYVTGYNT